MFLVDKLEGLQVPGRSTEIQHSDSGGLDGVINEPLEEVN